MTTTNPCCEECFGHIEGWERPQLGCKNNDCPCHQAATATPESKIPKTKLVIKNGFADNVPIPPESVPAQDWEKAFDAEIKDTPLASSAFGKGMVKDFIHQQIAAAREEGRHQGLIKAGNLVAYFIDHTKKQQPGRVMYMQGVEEGRRAMREETLAILVTEIAQAHKDGTPTARLTSAYNTISSK